MLLIDLNGQWQMKRVDETNWIPANVPGSVYSDLLNAGFIKDPFYRDNEYDAIEISKYDYEYHRTFVVSDVTLLHDRIILLCEGLDTLCDVLINGSKVLMAANMHRTYETDIKNVLKKGENEIRVIFYSPVAYCVARQKEQPLRNMDYAMDGIFHLRKAHYMFGWDWGPKLPDMGIWRSIAIRGYDLAQINDVYITQQHAADSVSLDVRVGLSKWEDSELAIRLDIVAPGGTAFSKTIPATAGICHIPIDIVQPELWWPNGYGAHPLYTVRVILLSSGRSVDETQLRIGLRTMTVRREKDQWGESFEFVVNGTPMFAMGADYIPEDNILARCNPERTKKLIRDCVKANFNTIRVWGGGLYPENYFYDLCDEYGLVVWQDLMYACGVYSLSDDFKENITQETVDNMKRLRHHASLGLWCGNNEQELGWAEWGWSEDFSARLKADYIRQFEILLPEIAKQTDPSTFYWLASPSSCGSFVNPNDENYGDMHFWGVWHGKLPFTAYRDIYPRFMSEFGIQSFPSLKTVETFTLPEDRNVFSYVMESHQKNGTGNEKILYYIGENFKMPKDFDALLYTSQLIQAEGLRYGVEHWRRNRGRCMGAVYWQLNDCWPVASWASIDCFGRWKALHYAARRFFAPVLISAYENGTFVSLHLTNDRRTAFRGVLAWRLMDTCGNVILSDQIMVDTCALSVQQCVSLDFSKQLDTKQKQRSRYLEFTLLEDDVPVSCGTVLFTKPKYFSFLDPQIEASVEEDNDQFILRLRSNAFAHFVELDIRNADAVFSDNYFDLSAGDVKEVRVDKQELSVALTTEGLKSALAVRSLFDTFV